MAITKTKLNRLATQLNKAPQYDSPESNKLFLFPFNIILGTTNSSEVGLFKDNYDPADFGSFEKIFSGRDSVLIKWEGSTTASKKESTDMFLTKNYKVGNYFAGTRTNTSSNTAFGSSSQDADFVSQRNVKDVNVQFNNWKPSENDIFKFYIIPESGTSNIFYIKNVNSYYNIETGKLIYSTITFTNLTTELGKSGRSIDNFVQFSAPGEGYAFPQVVNDENKKTVSLDEIRLKDRPVDEIQVEIFGPSLISGLTILGRPVGLVKEGDIYKNENKINAPRLLFPYKMTTPESSEISKTSASETNYYSIVNGSIDLITYWNDWREKVAGIYDLDKRKNYEGVIKTDYDEVLKTNSGVITKNDYWNESFKLSLADVDPETIKTVPFFDENFDFGLLSNISVSQFLTFNSLLFLDTERLPISITETTAWTFKSIPLIGAFLNLLTLGIPVGWQNQNIKLAAKKINGLIPCQVYDFGANGTIIGGPSKEGALPLDLLRNDTPDAISGLVGTNNVITSLRFKLTDQINDNGTTKNTVDLAQEGADGWLMNGDEAPTNPLLEPYQGYALDLINIKMLGKCDYKITALSNGAPVYSAKYQTKSKFSESVREWSNTIKLSNWNADDNQTIPYPEAITPKPPIDILDPIIETHELNYEGGLIVNSLYWKNKDKGKNRREITETQEIDMKKYFGRTLQQLVDEGYKRATLTFDFTRSNTDLNNYFKTNYKNLTLELDLKNTSAIDKLEFSKSFGEYSIWLTSKNVNWHYKGPGSLGGHVFFSLENGNFKIENNALINMSQFGAFPQPPFSTTTSLAGITVNGNRKDWQLKYFFKSIKITK